MWSEIKEYISSNISQMEVTYHDDQLVATTRRRKLSSDSCLRKCRKYNSFLPLIRGYEFCEESREEFETLIKFNVDVDYYDPEESDCTPLCYAVRNRLHDWTKLLLESGADSTLAATETDDGVATTASDMAWYQGDYDIVFELILADGPYPKDFKLENFNIPQSLRLKAFLLRTEALHNQIKENLFDEVELFVKHHDKIRQAYDSSNQSALTTALECRNFKIYTFLRFKGFTCGIDDHHDKIIASINSTRKEKKKLEREMRNYVQSSDIFNLLSKSRLGVDNDTAHFEKLQKYFERLYEIKEIQPILKIAANDKLLTITFDFNHSDIRVLDLLNCTDNVRGRTFRRTHRILIAANQNSEEEILGILIQELAHLTFLKIYNNNFCPYRVDDVARKINFAQVVEVSELTKNKEEIIANAFEYKQAEIEAELIARVPQLIVQNHPKKLMQNRETFKHLFDFYEQEVLKDIEREASLIEPKQLVQDLNKTLGVLYRMKTEKMRCWNSKIDLPEMLARQENIFIFSKLPELVLSNLIRSFRPNDSENIFVELEQLTIGRNFSLIANILETDWKPTIFVIDSQNDLGPKQDSNRVASILDQISDCKIIFISNQTFETNPEGFQCYPEIEFTFSDLISRSQQELLSSNVDFQRFSVELKKILGDDLEEIESWPLQELIDAFKIKFNNLESKFPKLIDVFVPRSFQISGSSDILSSDEVILKLTNQKTVIVSDVAGIGKTTSAVNFARTLRNANQLSWIVFFDLKQHVEVFETQKYNPDFDVTVEKMLKIEGIENKIFKLCFRNSKSTFIVDGFDEISPRYKEFVLKLMQHVQKSGNHLLVTTRTHLESELAEKLGSNLMPLAALKLLPFNEKDQIEFLTKFWSEKSETDFDEAHLIENAKQLLSKFKTTLNRKQFFLELPLQLYMLADLTSSNPDLLNIDFKIFSLCESFVKNKLNIRNLKGKLSLEDITEMTLESFDLILFHQKIAIESFYGKTVSQSLQLPEISESLNEEVICRIGFLQTDLNGKYQFSHQTFADFFIAQMLVKSVTALTSVRNFGILHNLLAKVLVGNTQYDENIRSLVNDKLEPNVKIMFKKEMSEKLEENLIIDSNYDFLERLIARKQNNLINFVLMKLELTKDLKMKIVKHKNSSNYIALHVATDCIDSFEFLLDCIESFTTESEQREILQIRGGVYNYSILQMSQRSGEEIFEFALQIHKSLFCDKAINSLLMNPEKINSQEGTASPLEMIWFAIEENFDPQHQKQLLIHFGIFHDLITSANGVQIALKTAKKLFSPEEFNKLMKVHFFTQEDTSTNGNSNKLPNFFHEFLNTEGRSEEFENSLERLKITEIGYENCLEYSLIAKTLEVLNVFIQQHNFKENNSSELFKFMAQSLVQISASQSVDLILPLWNFAEKHFERNEQKRVLLFKYKLINTLTAVARNRNKSALKFVHEKFNNLFTRSDFEEAVNNADNDWLKDAFSNYAKHADREAFEMFWFFIESNLEKKEQKLLFLEKKKNGSNTFMCSSQNKQKSTLEFLISIADRLLGPGDFAEAMKSKDQNWVVQTLCRYAAFAERETFEKFWRFVEKNISEDDQKLVFLQKIQNGSNAYICSTENKDKSTNEFVVTLLRNIFGPGGFAVASNAEELEYEIL